MRHLRSIPFASVLASVAAIPVDAQVSVTSNVALTSAYVWRGVTATNRPVIQPDVTLDLPLRAGAVTLGAWASIEPARYDGPSDISAVYGLLPGPAFTQYSVWADYGIDLPAVTLTTGVSAYLYPSVADLAALYNTIELSASASLSAPLAPSVSVWYDIGVVRGAYFESSVELERQVYRTPVSLALTAGVNAGQGPDAAGKHQTYFYRKGVSHLEASVTTSYRKGSVNIEPTAHLIRAFDPMAKVTTPSVSRALKLWIGTTVSWSSDEGESR